jgi:hypothetical protein
VQWLLINRTAPADALDAATVDPGPDIAAKLAPPLRVSKQTFYDQVDLSLADA